MEKWKLLIINKQTKHFYKLILVNMSMVNIVKDPSQSTCDPDPE